MENNEYITTHQAESFLTLLNCTIIYFIILGGASCSNGSSAGRWVHFWRMLFKAFFACWNAKWNVSSKTSMRTTGIHVLYHWGLIKKKKKKKANWSELSKSVFWIKTMVSIWSFNEESIFYLDLLNLKTYSASYFLLCYLQSQAIFLWLQQEQE